MLALSLIVIVISLRNSADVYLHLDFQSHAGKAAFWACQLRPKGWLAEVGLGSLLETGWFGGLGFGVWSLFDWFKSTIKTRLPDFGIGSLKVYGESLELIVDREFLMSIF